MRREIKRALKRRDAGYSSLDSDESKSEFYPRQVKIVVYLLDQITINVVIMT